MSARLEDQVAQNTTSIQTLIDTALKPSGLPVLVASIQDDDIITLEIKSTGEVVQMTKAQFVSSIVFTADVNSYSSILPPQLFNPDAGEVTADTGDYTLASSNSVAFVTINGQVLDDSEYGLAAAILTVTPDNGFDSITDEILAFQHSFNTLGTGGVVNNFRTISASESMVDSDYIIYCDSLLTLTFVTAIGSGGKTVIIKNIGVGIVTLNGFGTETIEGELTQNLLPGDSYTLSSDGANWNLI